MKYIHTTFEELEDDNRNVYHSINGEDVDLSTYCEERCVRAMVDFHKEFGFFPTRKDHPVNTCGALDWMRIEEIRQHLKTKIQ